MVSSTTRLLSTLAVTSSLLAAAGFLCASELKEPLTIASENGVLEILMVAKAAPVSTLVSSIAGGKAPVGWVYEICKRPVETNSCPAVSGQALNYYGGTLLQLEKGDTLKIHFVNELPPAFHSGHAQEPGREFLGMNPTNLHTHGMLVAPSEPTAAHPFYGDNVFVLTFNSANGTPAASPHMHSDIRMDFTDYEIKVPSNHPSGLFWFHPHAHGIALNQVSAGLSGIITVGHVNDYVCRERACSGFLDKIRTRHMILKDAQILPDGTLQDQEDPDFCQPTRASGAPPRSGSCEGDPESPDFAGGKWFFTINGQSNPTIRMTAAGGEIWRITNTSGSNTYDLKLFDPKLKRNMLMQVLSIDGVSVSPNTGMSSKHMTELGGGKFNAASCPASRVRFQGEAALCTRELRLMPSSRAEVWVVYRDLHDIPAAPPAGATAVLKDIGYQTGPSGDTWPAVDLAVVQFESSTRVALPSTLSVNGEASALLKSLALARDFADHNRSVHSDKTCQALPPGHMRRVYYGSPTTDLGAFGLAYEEVDEHGRVVGAPATDLEPFDPMSPTLCVPLGSNNSPVTERWQLINVATEDHNFHIHQVKFRVVSRDELDGTMLPNAIGDRGIMMDNVPLKHAEGTCGNNPAEDFSNPIADWRAGLCKSTPITIEIPFTIAGDFVYHCHILEHEDGGMMARIRVRPTK